MSGLDRRPAPPAPDDSSMTAGGTSAGILVRRRGGPQRATLLELLFDVVFVAILALTSMDFSRDLTWTGAVKAMVPLIALWWIWSITALLADFFDPQTIPIQVAIAGVMLGTVLAAASSPGAFADHGLFFAVSYVAVHIGRGVVLISASRDPEPRKRIVRFLFWFLVSSVPWLLGAFAHDTARALLWGAALVIDYVSGLLRYPTPRFGRIPVGHYESAGEHLGERYQQIMILALGDMILVATLRYSHLEPIGDRTITFLAAFASTVVLWQIYVFRAGAVLETEVRRHPTRAARWTPYTHLIMVVGVVTTSAGFEATLNRPGGTVPPGSVGAIFGGPALFLVGRILFEYEVFSRFSGTRSVALGVLVATAPLAARLSPAGAVVVAGVILLGIAASDQVRVLISRTGFGARARRP